MVTFRLRKKKKSLEFAHRLQLPVAKYLKKITRLYISMKKKHNVYIFSNLNRSQNFGVSQLTRLKIINNSIY